MSRGNRRSFMYQIKNRAKRGMTTSKGVKQGESQKIEFIFPVLDCLLQYTEFYASQLKQKIPELNHKSVDRTILLLQKKNLIVHDRTEIHNKKIFRIKSKTELKKYQEELKKYKQFKIFSNVLLQKKKVQTLDKYDQFNYRWKNIDKKFQKMAKNIQEISNYFYVKIQNIMNNSTYDPLVFNNKYSNSIIIEEMYSKDITKIIADFASGKICLTCFHEEKLQYLNEANTELVCKYGHVTDNQKIIFNNKYNEIFISSKNAKRLTYKQFKKDVKEYLKKKNTNLQSEYSEYIDDI